MLRIVQIIMLGFASLLIISCSDPLVMIPGKALSGIVTLPPASWQTVPETIQLETRPADPYSINIWAVGISENLYVATRDTRRMPFISADPFVKVRITGLVYELRANPVKDADELASVIEAYVMKYQVEQSDNWLETGIVYRLDRR